jgi:hypothetical protein
MSNKIVTEIKGCSDNVIENCNTITTNTQDSSQINNVYVVECIGIKTESSIIKNNIYIPYAYPRTWYDDVITIKCEDKFKDLELKGDPATKYLVKCEQDCSKYDLSYDLEGMGYYSENSNVCIAAQHVGINYADTEGYLEINIGYPQYFIKGIALNDRTSTKIDKAIITYSLTKCTICSLYMANYMNYSSLDSSTSFLQISNNSDINK